MEKVTIEFKGAKLEIEFEIERYYPATIEAPEEGGSFEITDILHEGVSVYDLVSEIKNYEELIIDKIMKQL